MAMNFQNILLVLFAALYLGYGQWSGQAVLRRTKGLVVITGCSSGIGRHAALHLASEGFYVLATVRREEDRAELLDADMSGKLQVELCDVTKEQDVQRLAQVARDSKHTLLALVNNAGVGSGRVPLELSNEPHMDTIMEVNYKGVVRTSLAFAAQLREDDARLVLISSVAAGITIPGGAVYSASKRAAEAFTRGLAQELRIRSTSIRPGYTVSDIAIKSSHWIEEAIASATPKDKEIYSEWFEKHAVAREWETKISKGATPEGTTEAIQKAITSLNPADTVVVSSLYTRLGMKLYSLLPQALGNKLVENA